MASTKAYTSQILCITMMALALAEDSISKRQRRCAGCVCGGGRGCLGGKVGRGGIWGHRGGCVARVARVCVGHGALSPPPFPPPLIPPNPLNLFCPPSSSTPQTPQTPPNPHKPLQTPLKPQRSDHIIDELGQLPGKIKAALMLDGAMRSLAEELKDEHSLLFFARGYNYATALEAALKVKEVALIHSEGILAGAFRVFLGGWGLCPGAERLGAHVRLRVARVGGFLGASRRRRGRLGSGQGARSARRCLSRPRPLAPAHPPPPPIPTTHQPKAR